MAEKKSEVRRLTLPEWSLVESLRDYDISTILATLELAIAAIPSEESEILRKMRSALKPESLIPLDSMVENNNISQQDKELLMTSISSNKHIAFIGQARTGKTTLMQSLMSELDDAKPTVLVESKPEMDFTYADGTRKNIHHFSSSMTTAQHFLELLKEDLNYVSYSEVLHAGDVISMLVTQVYGISTMFSASVDNESALKERLLSLVFEENATARFAEQIEDLVEHKLVIVHCINQDGDFKYKVIQG